MTRPQRRAAALIGLVMDLLAGLALAATVLAGVIPAGNALAPAVTLAAGITAGLTYLYRTRPRSKP